LNFILFILIACFWSGSFIAIQPLVRAMPPLTAGALRIGVAVVFLTILLPIMRLPFSIPKSIRLRIWFTGVVAFSIPFAFLFWGEKSISPGLAGILNGTVPIWVFILGLIFTPQAEVVTTRKILGLLSGIGGVVAIFLPKLLLGHVDNSLLGTIAVALMASSYGASVLMNRTLFLKNPNLNPFVNLYNQLIAAFIVLFLIAVVIEGFPHPENWQPFATVIAAEFYLGCVSTSIAFMMFYHLIRKWGSVRAATVTYVIPAVTLVFDLVINSHAPSLSDFLGVLGVTIGVIILNLPQRRRQASPI
jgi:drug/metabolite transporter (DMT)-like permease